MRRERIITSMAKPAPLAATFDAFTIKIESGPFDIHEVDAATVGRAITTYAAMAPTRRKLWHQNWQHAWIKCDHATLARTLDNAVRDGRLVETHSGLSARRLSRWGRKEMRTFICAEGLIEVWPTNWSKEIEAGALAPSLAQQRSEYTGGRQDRVDENTTTACSPQLWARTLSAWNDLAAISRIPGFQGYKLRPETMTLSDRTRFVNGQEDLLEDDEVAVVDHLEAVSLPLSLASPHPGIQFEVPRSATLKAITGKRRREAHADLVAFMVDTGASAKAMAAVERIAAA